MSPKAKNSGDKTAQKPLTRELLEQASNEQLFEIVLALRKEKRERCVFSEPEISAELMGNPGDTTAA